MKTACLQWLSRAPGTTCRCGWPAISMAKTWKPELTSPNLQLDISSNLCFQHASLTSEMPSRGVWPQQRQLVTHFRISPKPSCGRGLLVTPQQHPSPALVQSFIRFRFSSGPKGAVRTLTQTGLSCAAGESPFESWNLVKVKIMHTNYTNETNEAYSKHM